MTADNDKLSRLETASVGRLLWEYSLPSVVGMLVMSLYNVIDRIFIGQGVGTEAIAGLAITFPVMNVSAAVGVLVGVGASARISILLGSGNKPKAERTLGNALVLTVINAAIYITLFGLFIDPVLKAFGASEASLPYARTFMVNILPGLFFTNLAFSFNNIIRASGYPRRAMFTMFIGAGVNVILAPLFIFGFKWGIRGAAIATDIAMLVSAIFVMEHFFRKDSTLRFRRGIYRLSLSIIGGIIAIGAAPSLINLAGSFINILLNKTLYAYGSDHAVAAAGIFTAYTSLLCMIVIGICQGMQPIVGYNYGCGKLHRLKRAYWLAVLVSSAVMITGTLPTYLCPDMIARAFTTDSRLIEVTAQAFRTAMMAFPLVGFQIVSTNLFQSMDKAAKSIILSLSRQVIFLIPLLLYLPGKMGLQGVWYSFPISDLMATAVTTVLVTMQLRRIDRQAR